MIVILLDVFFLNVLLTKRRNHFELRVASCCIRCTSSVDILTAKRCQMQSN